jgi:hypothetical protein
MGSRHRAAIDPKEISLLFHIEQVHRPENCPYGHGGSTSLHDATVPDVRLLAMYGSFMEHVIYLIVEASDVESLNMFLLPGMKVCTAKITPVSDHPLPVRPPAPVDLEGAQASS